MTNWLLRPIDASPAAVSINSMTPERITASVAAVGAGNTLQGQGRTR